MAKRTNNDLQNITQKMNTDGELMCPGRVGSYCSCSCRLITIETAMHNVACLTSIVTTRTHYRGTSWWWSYGSWTCAIIAHHH